MKIKGVTAISSKSLNFFLVIHLNHLVTYHQTLITYQITTQFCAPLTFVECKQLQNTEQLFIAESFTFLKSRAGI